MKALNWIFILLLLSAFQCSDEEATPLPDTHPAPVTQVSTPDRAALGEPVTLEVSYTVVNGCGRFGHFSETRAGNTFTIAVHPVYEGEVCSQALQTLKESYTFTPATKGTYTFRFWQAQDQYLNKSITID